MEIEAKQKAMRESNRQIEGSFIRYLSTSVKCDEVSRIIVAYLKRSRRFNFSFPLQQSESTKTPGKGTEQDVESRNFLHFSDFKSFR